MVRIRRGTFARRSGPLTGAVCACTGTAPTTGHRCWWPTPGCGRWGVTDEVAVNSPTEPGASAGRSRRAGTMPGQDRRPSLASIAANPTSSASASDALGGRAIRPGRRRHFARQASPTPSPGTTSVTGTTTLPAGYLDRGTATSLINEAALIAMTDAVETRVRAARPRVARPYCTEVTAPPSSGPYPPSAGAWCSSTATRTPCPWMSPRTARPPMPRSDCCSG